MAAELEIDLCGELNVRRNGAEIALPASRKARALLAYLASTGRPHRRERLCEIFWDGPDDPKAGLRWALSKLRAVTDSPDCPRIVADRERVALAADGVRVDLNEIHARLRQAARLDIAALEDMALALDRVPFDGLDDAGDDGFMAWLTAEREDARLAQIDVLRRLATHAEMSQAAAAVWFRRWQAVDPVGAERHAARSGSAAAAARPTQATDPAHAGRRALRAQNIGYCDTADGVRIAYGSIGSGPPLLKAANWLNHLEFDWNSPIWGKSFAAIARYRKLIRYDERGCGLSDWNVADISFDAFVADLEAVVDGLGLERFPLLGISQGCAVSIEYAARHPERVTGLVLLSGYAAGWRISATPEEQERREAVKRLTELGWGTDNPAYRHIFSQTFMPDATAADLAWFDEFQRLTTSPQNAARFQDAFGTIDVRHRLSDIGVPTLVLHSRHDQRIPLEQGRALALAIPGAEFVALDSHNHILMDSEPAWRDCFEAVAGFMDRNEL